MSRKPTQQSRAIARNARRDAAFWKDKSKSDSANRQFFRDAAARRLKDARKEERKW